MNDELFLILSKISEKLVLHKKYIRCVMVRLDEVELILD